MKAVRALFMYAALLTIPASSFAEDKLPFNLVTREQWGAQWVNPNSYTSAGTIVKFTLHHTAMAYPANLEAAKTEMRKIQKEVMTWGTDTAYHYIISPQGDVFQGIPDDKLGTHALNDNYGNIGICFMGNYMNDTPTRESQEAFVNLVKYLKDKYPGIAQSAKRQGDPDPKRRAFILHRETYATLCPGDKLVALQGELFARIFSDPKSEPLVYRDYTAAATGGEAYMPDVQLSSPW